jgi:hypothetical protein
MENALDEKVDKAHCALLRYWSVCSLYHFPGILPAEADENMLSNWQTEQLVSFGQGEPIEVRIVVDLLNITQSDALPPAAL